ncbi:hypothetical protein EXIGLDRAFT_778371 [Exidia glandulosa HHB12029]|uniref:Uncharacterized protein n=1 Tax=Exidia glandulosa HHB12029 TaxID=1314781 RepID=A0A165CJR2_EXIGL|nr:hypothetical protein EXIGLDRAFT_778371 [Exidia glandulosa HHB12029]
MQSLSPQNTTGLPSGPSQPEASNDTRPLRRLSSSPPELGVARHEVNVILAAFEEAVSRYRQGEENGPYELRGEFSQADFEELDRHELKCRLAYDKIKKNPDNPYDPFITVFFSNCRERRPYYMSTRGSVATRAVIHEWPRGSRSAVAAQEGPMINQSNFDSLNLETATSPLSSNPAPVHYGPDFDAEVIFHSDGDPANILQLPFGQAWAPDRRTLTENIKFCDQDWDSVQPFSVNIHLGELRGIIIEHMHHWIEDGSPS